MKESAKSRQKVIIEIQDLQREIAVLKAIMLQYEEEEKQLQNSLGNLNKILNQTINALTLVIKTRDPYTAIHQQRVTALACTIAEELNLSLERIKGLKVAAALHDIGKIGIPLDILIKPGKLTQLEHNLIKEHCRIGYTILKEIKFPWPVAQIVLQHHERADGSGYPSGLSSNDILLESKIIGVADVFEAMASHRPYRSSLGLDQSINEIISQKGILFDPEVVEACIKIFSENRLLHIFAADKNGDKNKVEFI